MIKRKPETIAKYKAYEGKRFGRLTIVEAVFPDNDARVRVRCKCDCGKETTIQAASILNGKVKSCGCLYREYLAKLRGEVPAEKVVEAVPAKKEVKAVNKATKRTAPSKVGDKYGKLTILEILPPSDEISYRGRRARCKCECGNEAIVLLKSLRSGQTQSCGCLPKGRAAHRAKAAVAQKIAVPVKASPVTAAPVVEEPRVSLVQSWIAKIKNVFGFGSKEKKAS